MKDHLASVFLGNFMPLILNLPLVGVWVRLTEGSYIRHLSASILYSLGYEVAVIQAILRHKSPSTTERYLRSIGLERVQDAL